MSHSDWRNPSAYADTHNLGNPGYAWEYLRRDGAYRHDYQRIAALPASDTEARSAFSARWGLRFRGRSRPARFARCNLLAA